MTLRRGGQGMPRELIMELQKNPGIPADGDFGPKTEAAVRAFQRENGMVPDGIAGPKTWLALKVPV